MRNLVPDEALSVNVLIWLNIILLLIIILYFFFRILLPWVTKYRSEIRGKRMIQKKSQEKTTDKEKDAEAAIAMALYLYFNEMHDEESDVITVKLFIKPGEYVSKNQRLFSLEAMKMENEIKAERDGVIAGIRVTEGQSVLQDEVIMEMN